MTTVRLTSATARMGEPTDAVEQTWDSVVVMDADGRILHVNGDFERATGFRAEQVVGRHISAIHGDLNDIPWPDLVAHVIAGEPWTGEIVRTRSDGSKHMAEACVTPVHGVSGHIAAYVSMTRDSTGRREGELRARQRERLESLGQLAAGIAHDFNNLLAAIHGFGEFVQDALPEGTEARRDMDEVMRAADSAADLTRQLLMFSRKQPATPAPVDLGGVVEGIAGLLRRLLSDDIELSIERGDGVGHVYADPRGLEQMVLNLVVNARDAMPGGGVVRVCVKPSIASIEGGPEREVVRLTVEDTGTGMSPETLAQIQEPFFTTKEPGQGTGLGLTTVHAVARAAGGAITVVSALGEGTTFTIDLPAVPAWVDSSDSAAPAAVRGSETVLLAEDDPILRAMYARHLADLGYRVMAAANGEVGLELMRTRVVVPDVVVSDAAMPGMRGPELVRALRRVRPGLPAILISGLPVANEDAKEWIELHKPFTSGSLAAAIRGLLDAPPRLAPRDAP